MVEKDKIQFNFSYYALNLLGKQMYTNRWSAISELIANGLDAGATKVNLYIESIDKKNSILEIIDNGSGMDYDDLSTKYALIGRNKRLSNEDLSEKTKGRKGIGKLATLFLSKKYYIVSKKDGIASAWMLDSTNALDSDIPELVRVSIDDVHIENTEIWDGIESGTLIKSVGVNLSGFAEGKLESLKMALANYYLLDNLGADIEVAYRTDVNQAIEYSKVSKVIGFKNFYAFFQTDNTVVNMDLLNDSVKISADLEEVSNKLRPVKRIFPSEISRISLTGKGKFLNVDGELEEITYNLIGWIGIHSTINMTEALENTGIDTKNRFIRNQVYKANQLRLYVRDKLAVSDFMPLLNNTQAFGAYIEGEISFDVLDHDRLEDISTTNREGLSGNDERITLLINLLKPIVNKLISERANIGAVVRKEVEYIRDKEKAELEKRKRQAEDERIREIEARKLAEQSKREAELAQREEEAARKEEEQRRKEAEKTAEELKKENDRKDILLQSNNSAQQKLLTHELTGIYRNIDSVNKNIANDFKSTGDFDRVSKYVVSLKKSSGKLFTIKNQILKLNTSEVQGKQYIDIKKYIKSYLETLDNVKIKIFTDFSNIPHKSRVHIFDLGVVIDNLLINAMDQEADKICFRFDDKNNILIISSNKPLSNKIKNKDDIFRLGFTTKENGTGVGMYIVKEICKKFKWDISVGSNNKETYFTIELREN
ncbi:TPA: ATP-binding protein [Streptococcus suis]|nr:GHKL domain-containing protein [Streptococcus suis]HEL1588817.1 ATP-binding protein [Streptococcus suis]HEL1736519.1 ATP-binding protein [Streptococcus suis]HEL2013162.1 ATP-binding protein [Streptococcus suis]HEL2019784.1 ATP-binding protein [Streptococcus suis]